MVKRIDSTRTPTLSGSQPVEPGKAVETAKVGEVHRVGATEAQAPTRSIRRPTRPMTAAEREVLFKLVQEEAEKMFAESSLPPDKRQKVETAVKMAIDGGLLAVDPADEKKK